MFPEVSSWAPLSRGSNGQWRYKVVGYWFGPGSISFLTEASHTFNSWPSILALEGNSMLYEANKQVSRYSWHRVQN